MSVHATETFPYLPLWNFKWSWELHSTPAVKADSITPAFMRLYEITLML